MSADDLFKNAPRLKANAMQWQKIESRVMSRTKSRSFLAYRWPIAAVLLIGLVAFSIQYFKPSYQTLLSGDSLEQMVAWDFSSVEDENWITLSDTISLFTLWEDEAYWND